MFSFFSDPDIWLYLAMPVISGVVGWGTNVLAIKMMFYPIEFIGIPPYCGWQGIVPSKIATMASMTVHLITTKLISVKEVFSQIDPLRVAHELQKPLEAMIEPMLHDIMTIYSPRIWETLPEIVKKRIYVLSKKDLPESVSRIMTEIKDNIEELLNIEKLVIDALLKDKTLMNSIFLQCGQKEFKFIEKSGLYFGFLFGMIQMLVWYFFKSWWLLPLGGLMVGWLTNWIALKLIFQPIRPVRIGPFVIQGLFFRRQAEVAQEYGKLIAGKILTARSIIDTILRGPAADEVCKIIQFHTKKSIDKTTGLTKPLVQVVIGTREYIEIKNTVCDQLIESLPRSMRSVETYAEETLNIKNLLTEKLGSLSSQDYMGILRPAFQQDEWKLIVAGGIIGLCVGIFQLFFMFK